MSETICIIGQGYVGLPLALAFDEEGYDVIGFDISDSKIESLVAGTDPTGDHGDALISDSTIEFTTSPQSIERASIVIVTVPTPVDDSKNPDLSYIEAAAETIGEHVAEETTIVLESTVYPGVTRTVFGPVIEAQSGLTIGDELSLGYSPERLSPGESGSSLSEVKKIVSGSDAETEQQLFELYGSVVDAGIYRAPTLETAEAAKVTENVQRDLNIALMNELSIICDHMDLDTQEVLAAAGSKWNFHEYRPGLVGGHCIPIDPLYLAHGSERVGYRPQLIMQGREVNEYMSKHTAELAMRALNRSGKVLKESRILILGLSYKANIGDMRSSQVAGIVSALTEYDIEIVGYDPLVDPETASESFDIPIIDALTFDDFDGIIVATGHDEFAALSPETMTEQLNDDPVLIDVGTCFEKDRAREAGFDYDRL